MGESRVRYLEQTLSTLGYNDSLRAMDWMIQEMSAEKGHARHNGTHYYYHLVDVAQDLLSFGIRKESIITSAILHDSIEDVDGVTYFMIRDKFGHEVVNMVDLVTKRKDVDYKDGANLKAYLELIKNSVGAALIKTADRKHNFGTLLDATPEKKHRQALETEKYFIPFFKECRNLYPRYAHYFFAAKTAIEPHLWEIKEHYAEIAELKAQFEQSKYDEARYQQMCEDLG
jgi:(p)ppGpp synthase/HD superfamily hydrolase